MHLVDYVKTLRRRWRMLVTVVVLVTFASVGSTFLVSPSYSSTASVYFSLPSGQDANDLSQGSTYTQSQMQSYSQLATSPLVLRAVIEQLGLDTTTKQLARDISVTAEPDSVILTVIGSAGSAAGSAALTNAVAEQLNASVRSLSPRNSGGDPTVRATIVGEATPPAFAASPNRRRSGALGLLAGLALGLALALGRERLDTKIRTRHDVAQLTGAPVINEMTDDKSLEGRAVVVRDAPLGVAAEEIRRLRTNLSFLSVDQSTMTVVITSSVPGEGKSSTATNLAVACAEAGERVLLVDADLRKPTLAEYTGLEPSVGLTTILAGRADFDDVVQPYADTTLDVLMSGVVPPNASELLSSTKMASLLSQLEERYSVILIDSPPLLPVTDASILARQVAGAIVVVRAGKVNRDQLAESLGSLVHAGAKTLGLVLRGKPRASSNTYATYGEQPSTAGSVELISLEDRTDLSAARAKKRARASSDNSVARTALRASGTSSRRP